MKYKYLIAYIGQKKNKELLAARYGHGIMTFSEFQSTIPNADKYSFKVSTAFANGTNYVSAADSKNMAGTLKYFIVYDKSEWAAVLFQMHPELNRLYERAPKYDTVFNKITSINQTRDAIKSLLGNESAVNHELIEIDVTTTDISSKGKITKKIEMNGTIELDNKIIPDKMYQGLKYQNSLIIDGSENVVLAFNRSANNSEKAYEVYLLN